VKNVGIVSCYFKNNYGSMLQAYATKMILDKNNIPNETVNIDYNIDFIKGKKNYYMSQIFNFKFILSKFGMLKMKILIRMNKNLRKNIHIREKKYKEFRNEINLSPKMRSYSDLTKYAKFNYSDVIVGSDQLWLPVNVVSDYYTLNWVPNDINKISYATSMGISHIPNKYNNLYNSFLKKINHLSVREKDGVRIIKEITNINAKIVCDPTLLLTKKDWEKEAKKERIIKEKYILCYFLGNNINHRKFAEKLKKETKTIIVSLNHADEYVKYSDIYADFIPYDIGPREWISLIRDAEYICTDSFHGTLFSIIFNKIFFSFRRYDSKSVSSTNSRIDSLLELVGISKERILTGNENVKKILEYNIDYINVNQKLDILRNESEKWLINSISNYDTTKCEYINIKDKFMCTGCSVCKNK